jgi:hypothetical protein
MLHVAEMPGRLRGGLAHPMTAAVQLCKPAARHFNAFTSQCSEAHRPNRLQLSTSPTGPTSTRGYDDEKCKDCNSYYVNCVVGCADGARRAAHSRLVASSRLVAR